MDKIFFRVDGASFIGYGHLYRTFVLAKEFLKKEYEVFYITRDFDGIVEDLIREKGFNCIPILGHLNTQENWSVTASGMDPVILEDLTITSKLAGGHILVCDNYSLSSDYYFNIRENVKVLAAFDDLNDREYPVDVLINQNFGSEKFDFKVRPDTTILAGLKYVLIRDELIEAKKRVAGSDKGYLLVMFGATDPLNYTDLVIEALQDESLKIVAVAGRGNPQGSEIEKKWKGYKRIQVFVDPPDIDDIMAGARAVVTAAGSSVWEFVFLEKPMMVVQTAPNQRYISEAFNINTRNFIFSNVEGQVNGIRSTLVDFFNNPQDFLPSISNINSVDGNGKQRILQAALDACST